MDNRFFLWAAVGLLWLMVYQTWLQDQRPSVVSPAPAAGNTVLPGETAIIDSVVPGLPDSVPTLADGTPQQPGAAVTPAAPAHARVSVTTDVYDLTIDTRGARVLDVALKKYPKKKDRPDDLVMLLDETPAKLLLIQSGVVGAEPANAPNHEVVFSAAAQSYKLGDADELVVPLTWRSADGLTATKVFRFRRGSYAIDVETTVTNGTGAAWTGAAYLQIQRQDREKQRSFTDVDSYSFVGPVVYDGDATRKYKPKELRKEPLDFSTAGGWVASIQHHFLSAAIPDPDEQVRYRSRITDDDRELLSAVGPAKAIAAGTSQTFGHTLFIGPKYQSQLDATAPGLVRTVDYGVLSVISQPLFWLLQKIHGLLGNWGWAIIFMTMLIKVAFYPLAEKSGRSMAKMRNLAPRMKAMQERYKDDRQALSKAMMELYKREKVNPMSSCLPLLLQMPVFLALYWVLIESVELRQAPWILWINDLSSRDPFFILPAIMAGAMFIQTKLNPPPADPTTAKVMQIMPLMMSVFFAFFPAGLVLYWVVNTVLSVAQQWRINRVVEAEAKAAAR